MPRKKSIRLAAQLFKLYADDLMQYLRELQQQHLDDRYVSWSFDYGIIALYREFEKLVLECLVGAINNDTSTLSQATGYGFPPHLSDEVCRFLVVGNGYFDFRGPNDLIKSLKSYLPEDHYLIAVVKKKTYKDTLEKLGPLRNFAAHGSAPAKKAVLKAIGQRRVGSSGSWLKRQERFALVLDKLKQFATEIEGRAPY